MNSRSIISLSIFCLVSCNPSKSSIDFVPEGSFTKGIEGPATDFEGNIFAVNFKEEGTIGKVTPQGKSSVFIKLADGSIGNGIRFGEKNQMFVADYTNHNILEIDLNTRKVKVFAHESKANQPNDLAVLKKKILFASDPNWSDSTGQLWRITADKGFELLEKNMGTTNCFEVNPEGTKLYVNESVQRKIWVYDITSRGRIENKKLFYAFEDFGLDGMRTDTKGVLYVCRYGKGTLALISPQGKLIREILLKGKKPSNLTFSIDYTKCFITLADRGTIEVVDL
mgnify:FL=1